MGSLTLLSAGAVYVDTQVIIYTVSATQFTSPSFGLYGIQPDWEVLMSSAAI